MKVTPRPLIESGKLAGPPRLGRAAWVARYRRSGLTQPAFVQAHGLKLGVLRYWVYGSQPKAVVSAARPRLQELCLPVTEATCGWGAEIRLPDGCRMRLQTELARELVAPLLHGR